MNNKNNEVMQCFIKRHCDLAVEKATKNAERFLKLVKTHPGLMRNLSAIYYESVDLEEENNPYFSDMIKAGITEHDVLTYKREYEPISNSLTKKFKKTVDRDTLKYCHEVCLDKEISKCI